MDMTCVYGAFPPDPLPRVTPPNEFTIFHPTPKTTVALVDPARLDQMQREINELRERVAVLETGRYEMRRHGTCPSCGKLLSLRRDGRIRCHWTKAKGCCPGSYELPKRKEVPTDAH